MRKGLATIISVAGISLFTCDSQRYRGDASLRIVSATRGRSMAKTRRGACHCGAVEFEVELLNGFKDLRRCNCSLCRRKGAIMASVPLDKLKILRGENKLSLYQWNTRTAKHYFCSVCGIYTHHQRRSNPNEFGFNVACLDGVNPYELRDIQIADGASNTLIGEELTR